MKHITIIEDDRSLNDGIVPALGNERYRFTQHEALGEYDPEAPTDLILLDLNLPDGSGLDFLRALRQRSAVPVIILTANDLETDEVAGLTLGADDYITKPFSLMVLRARIDKVLKTSPSAEGFGYSDETYAFDFASMRFLVHGEQVELSKTEQKLLRLLVANKGQTLTRDTLIDRIWTDDAAFVEENALSVTVNRLRRKLGDSAHIQTVYGIGYVWRSV